MKWRSVGERTKNADRRAWIMRELYEKCDVSLLRIRSHFKMRPEWARELATDFARMYSHVGVIYIEGDHLALKEEMSDDE